MKANVLRKKFLDFFATKEHRIVASDSLVPVGDATVLFTSAGMNQFKRQFLGQTTDFSRAVSCQKCLRTDDLDKVGKTHFHHTFFEMLGNFSFGDYFKDDAIQWAWEFLTKCLNLPKERFWVSVYKEDKEAYEIWLRQIKMPKAKIIKLGDKDNFWPSEAKKKGPNGPCGPCSEIFYDYGKNVGCRKKHCNPNCDCGRFSEVWNLVFTQFNRKEAGVLEPLPNKNIDTGMGLERLTAIMQGVLSNFDTDLFIPIINVIKRQLNINNPSEEQLIKIKIIADHIRAIVFAICDGVFPSNEQRGYIIRKLIRISINSYRSLDLNKPLLYKIVPAVTDVMKEPYPELLKRRENIAEIIKKEEESFLKILKEKEPALEKEIIALYNAKLSKEEIPKKLGKLFFSYYDTSGVPVAVSEDIAKKYFTVKEVQSATVACLEVYMPEQKKRSRAASTMSGDVFKEEEIKIDLMPTKFVGYENIQSQAKVLKIFNQKNKEVKTTKELKTVKIILDNTPFYPEAGGQVGDKGAIYKAEQAKIEVLDTQKSNEIIIHIARVIKGWFKVGDRVTTVIDKQRRFSIARNHTATHLLQAALRKVLGEHVQQQGSLVAEEKLRFDFTHFKQITKEELDRVEEIVNEYIMENEVVEVEQKSTEVAKKEGALAFFGEKYSDKSRVVSVGRYSKELCGGTHVKYTGEIGLFKIIGESSIAQGIRRIEATTGRFAYKLVKHQEEEVQEIARTLKTDECNLSSKITKLINALKLAERKLSDIKMKSIRNSLDEIISDAEELDGIKVIAKKIDDVDFSSMRSIIDMLKKKLKSAIICLGSIKDEKALLVLGITDNLKAKGFDASEMVKKIATVVGGSGGGRADLAQAGGNKANKLNEALINIYRIAKQIKNK
jgi:alanyl-tRNA synthetase